MRRAWVLAVVLLSAALAQAQSPPVPELPSVALATLDGALCPTPFRSACPPPPGDPVCRVRQAAQSRDGRVHVEVVEDGWRNDLVALHLVVRIGTAAFVQRDIGRDGVGCGTDDLYGARFDVTELSVRDVLGDRAPEVVLRADHANDSVLYVCSTGGAAPRCARTLVARSQPRFVRPDFVIVDGARVRLAL